MAFYRDYYLFFNFVEANNTYYSFF